MKRSLRKQDFLPCRASKLVDSSTMATDRPCPRSAANEFPEQRQEKRLAEIARRRLEAQPSSPSAAQDSTAVLAGVPESRRHLLADDRQVRVQITTRNRCFT
jgi:hypothetical protein